MKKLLLSIVLLLSGAYAMSATSLSNSYPQNFNLSGVPRLSSGGRQLGSGGLLGGPAPTEKECISAASRLLQQDMKSPKELNRLNSIISRCPLKYRKGWQ